MNITPARYLSCSLLWSNIYSCPHFAQLQQHRLQMSVFRLQWGATVSEVSEPTSHDNNETSLSVNIDLFKRA
jgi:hypothetical protein